MVNKAFGQVLGLYGVFILGNDTKKQLSQDIKWTRRGKKLQYKEIIFAAKMPVYTKM